MIRLSALEMSISVTLHSSDTATNFVADGLGINMRPWARNELVIVGLTEIPRESAE